MTFLSPWALVWLGSLPVLFWLWRLSSSRRQTRVASLVPYEHLLRRQPSERTRLFVNLLFWLQLAALLLLVLALLQPVIFSRRGRTSLVIVDTSASMAARDGVSTAFRQATDTLRRQLARKRPADAWFLVTTAPVEMPTERPTADTGELAQAIRALRVSHLAGNLGSAAQIGRGVLEGHVDHTLVVTDEPAPEAASQDALEWYTVGTPLANAAIVGLDAQGPLCSAGLTGVMVSLQNFSDDPLPVTVRAEQRGRQLASASVELPAQARTSVPLELPDATEGWVDIQLVGVRDALAIDNRAQVFIRQTATIPVVLLADRPEVRETLGAWLDACDGLVWLEGPPAEPIGPSVIVTDRQDIADPNAVGILRVPGAAVARRVVLANWLVSPAHPIGSYLPAIEPMVASLSDPGDVAPAGELVVWGVVDGMRTPIVLAAEQAGRRAVWLHVDPSATPRSVPLVVLFFNSLRWLMEQTDVVRTGEPLLVPSLPAGWVTVKRPDGARERIWHRGGTFRYDATTAAGTYDVEHGSTHLRRAVNFLDPVESNVMEHRSTWSGASHRVSTAREAPRTAMPLATWLAAIVLGLLLGEWWLYSRRRA